MTKKCNHIKKQPLKSLLYNLYNKINHMVKNTKMNQNTTKQPTQQLSDMLLKQKPVEILKQIRKDRKQSYTSNLAKEVDTTYAHAVKIVGMLEDHNLVTTQKQGRKKILQLTNKGKEVADSLINLENTLKQQEEEKNIQQGGIITSKI